MQIRYVDWHGVDVNCTRKFEMENGIGNVWKEWKSGGCKEEYLKAKILLNQHYILHKKTLRLNSLVTTTVVKRTAFSNWQKG